MEINCFIIRFAISNLWGMCLIDLGGKNIELLLLDVLSALVVFDSITLHATRL